MGQDVENGDSDQLLVNVPFEPEGPHILHGVQRRVAEEREEALRGGTLVEGVFLVASVQVEGFRVPSAGFRQFKAEGPLLQYGSGVGRMLARRRSGVGDEIDVFVLDGDGREERRGEGRQVSLERLYIHLKVTCLHSYNACKLGRKQNGGRVNEVIVPRHRVNSDGRGIHQNILLHQRICNPLLQFQPFISGEGWSFLLDVCICAWGIHLLPVINIELSVQVTLECPENLFLIVHWKCHSSLFPIRLEFIHRQHQGAHIAARRF